MTSAEPLYGTEAKGSFGQSSLDLGLKLALTRTGCGYVVFYASKEQPGRKLHCPS